MLDEDSMLREPKITMFVVAKASETTTVEGPVNTVLRGLQSVSFLVFIS